MYGFYVHVMFVVITRVISGKRQSDSGNLGDGLRFIYLCNCLVSYLHKDKHGMELVHHSS